MEFRLLGPVEVLRDGRPVPLGGAKPRALLALLLLHANEVVSRDRLIDALWGDRPPGTAGHSLDVQISRLRKAFEPDELLLTQRGGYVLQVEPEQIDVHRFERLLEERAGGRTPRASRPRRSGARVGARTVARRCARRSLVRDVRAERDRAPGGAPIGRDRGAHRRRARAWAARHADP